MYKFMCTPPHEEGVHKRGGEGGRYSPTLSPELKVGSLKATLRSVLNFHAIAIIALRTVESAPLPFNARTTAVGLKSGKSLSLSQQI